MELFHSVPVSQILTMHTLNILNFIFQLYLKKIEEEFLKPNTTINIIVKSYNIYGILFTWPDTDAENKILEKFFTTKQPLKFQSMDKQGCVTPIS